MSDLIKVCDQWKREWRGAAGEPKPSYMVGGAGAREPKTLMVHPKIRQKARCPAAPAFEHECFFGV